MEIVKHPRNWEHARALMDDMNFQLTSKECMSATVMKWDWDCNFKLDYDSGVGLLSVCSRFYPSNDGWDGSVTFMILDVVVHRKEFVIGTLNELRDEVEKYVEQEIERIHKELLKIIW